MIPIGFTPAKNVFKRGKKMSEQNYENFITLELDKPPKLCFQCVLCKNEIPCSGGPVFPICENCRKILSEFVQNHKSNWGK